jgi:hypothetical protein
MGQNVIRYSSVGARTMVDGMLMITLDPPYMHFRSEGDDRGYRRICTLEEIQEVLGDYGNGNWPLRDCLVRIHVSLAKPSLLRFTGLCEEDERVQF